MTASPEVGAFSSARFISRVGFTMTKLKALALAGAVAAAWGRLAIAADLPPAPPLPPPSPPDFEEFSGWYLRGDVGMGIATAPNLENKPDPVALGVSTGFLSPYANQGFYNTTLSPFGMIDVGLGYQLNNWFRVDGTLEYRGGANLQSLYALTDSASPAFGPPGNMRTSTAPTSPRSLASSTAT